MDKDIKNLLNAENMHIKKLQEIVKQTIDDENPNHSKFIEPSEGNLREDRKCRTGWQRFGGQLGVYQFIYGRFGGVDHLQCNSSKGEEFDPYPFILMNLVLSCIAALQAPIIMMSQNRQEEKDRKRKWNDYLINLKAELEIRALH